MKERLWPGTFRLDPGHRRPSSDRRRPLTPEEIEDNTLAPADLRAGLIVITYTIAEARRELVLSPALSKACPALSRAWPREAPSKGRRVVEGPSRTVLVGWVRCVDCAAAELRSVKREASDNE